MYFRNAYKEAKTVETKLMFSFGLYIFAYRLAAGDTRLQQYNILVRRFSFVCGCSEGSVGIDVTEGYSGEKNIYPSEVFQVFV